MTEATDHLIIRSKTLKTKDDGEQQTVEAEGRVNEQIGGPKHGAPRQQGYPLSSHLPKGSIGLMLMPGGDPSQAVMIFGEHPEFRPKELGEGEWKLYDKWGGELYATEEGWVLKVTKFTVETDMMVIKSGDIRLGGEDANRPVAAQGTVDSSGDVLVSNFLTCVKGK